MIKKFKKKVRTHLLGPFYSTDFDCKCDYEDCTYTIIDVNHVEKLVFYWKLWKRDITILHGFRCEKFNKSQGGTANSRHPKGDATDIVVRGNAPQEVAVKTAGDFNGVGIYDGYIHLDSRPDSPSSWDLRKKK